MTLLRFAGIHECADGIAYTDSIKRCVVTTFIIALLFQMVTNWLCMQCGVVCLLCGCVTLVLPMSFFSSSQTVLVVVTCDSASLHILFYYYLLLRCRHVARAGHDVIAPVILLLTITLTILPSSYHLPCRNNSSLFCRYS